MGTFYWSFIYSFVCFKLVFRLILFNFFAILLIHKVLYIYIERERERKRDR